MINFKQTNGHSSHLAKAALASEEDDNLVISGSDGVLVKISHLWLFSPLVRSILESLSKVEQHLIILPGLSSQDITKALGILQGPDPDHELIYFNKNAKVVLETLGIDLTSSELVKRTDGNLKIARRGADNNQSQEVNCRYCGRQFSGCLSKLKDKLKCHIGNIHFSQEMQKEISVFFNNDHECKECGKSYHQEHMKRKHLTFNHSYLVEQIMDQVFQSLELEPAKHPAEPENEENDIQKMLVDTNFRDDEITKEDEDFQNQLMLIQNLSDSEDDDADDEEEEVTITNDCGALLISQETKPEIPGESLLMEDNFDEDEGEDWDKEDKYDISSDEED